MTAPNPRPGVVEAAYWSWVVAGALLIVGGFVTLTTSFNSLRAIAAKTISDEEIRQVVNFDRAAGSVWVVAGAAVAYYAFRVRKGDKRSRRVALIFSIVLAVLVAVFALSSTGMIWLAIIVLLITAATLVMRPAARQWCDTAEPPPGSASAGGDRG
jgi:uncharacterized membrane protein HdeD (DUF308 family)